MSLLKRADLWLFLLCAALFLGLPELDLGFSSLFYLPDQGWAWRRTLLVNASYELFAHLHLVVAPLLLVLLLLSWVRLSLRPWRRKLGFLLLVMALGPGVMVENVIKPTFERARPSKVEEFGGELRFSPALARSDQCSRNCSFVSGHAAAGFYLVTLAWVSGRRRWLTLGIVVGTAVGLGRVIQGAHFLSDVVFSFWTVYFTALACAWLLFRRGAIRSPATAPTADA